MTDLAPVGNLVHDWLRDPLSAPQGLKARLWVDGDTCRCAGCRAEALAAVVLFHTATAPTGETVVYYGICADCCGRIGDPGFRDAIVRHVMTAFQEETRRC